MDCQGKSTEKLQLRWTAWNNGQNDKTGNGYGLKVPIVDRDRYFESGRTSVTLILPGSNKEIVVNVRKKSFWSDTCRELISKELGEWLIRTGLAPWPKGNPPKLKVTILGDGRFRIEV